MPIADASGIRRAIRTDRLCDVTVAAELDAAAEEIGLDWVVPGEIALFSIPDRFSEEQPILFCLGSSGIEVGLRSGI